MLLGEKSSWICGIIEDVTFSIASRCVVVNFIDGSELNIPLEAACMKQLDRVVNEVHLSFAPPPPAPKPRAASPSGQSSSGVNSPRRSTSSILYSIFSPLIPGSNGPAQDTRASLPSNPQPPARAHRRQARSILVDTYRQFVLPAVRGRLPESYITWAIASESHVRMVQFEEIREQVNTLLSSVQVDAGVTRANNRRSTSSLSVSSGSDSDHDSMPITPATSVFSISGCSTPPRKDAQGQVSPQAYLLSIPPAQALPAAQRNTYTMHVGRLSAIASRLASIRKLQTRHDREEGKRKWLEVLEAGRLADRALRRGFSAGQIRPTSSINADPIKRSSLWRSFSASDIDARKEYAHPAMSASDDECVFESESEDEEDDASDISDESSEEGDFPITPRRSGVTGIADLAHLTIKDHDGMRISTRPALTHRPAVDDDLSALLGAPIDENDDADLLKSSIGLRWSVQAADTPLTTTKYQSFGDWDSDDDEEGHVEVFHHTTISVGAPVGLAC